MEKIYITGIAGMLGSNLAYNLSGKYIITGADNTPVSMQNIVTNTYNMLDYKELKRNLSNERPDYLIHTVALVSVDGCEENPEAAYMLNTDLTREISEICAEQHIKMIYISTDAVFDGKDEKLYIEDDEVRPVNIYGKSKYEGEKFVINNGGTVLRTNIYGYNLQNKWSFGEWILYSLLEGKTLEMFDDIYFSPILVNELSRVIELTIKNNLSGLYHACGSGSINKYDFGCFLKMIFGITTGEIIRTQSANHKFKAKRSHNMSMSNKKIKDALGIDIHTPEESIIYFKKLYDEEYHTKLKHFGGVI